MHILGGDLNRQVGSDGLIKCPESEVKNWSAACGDEAPSCNAGEHDGLIDWTATRIDMDAKEGTVGE